MATCPGEVAMRNELTMTVFELEFASRFLHRLLVSFEVGCKRGITPLPLPYLEGLLLMLAPD